MSLAEAGLLLAANRLVRIAGYGWVARYYAVHGPRAACLLAAAGSVLATLGYALSSGLLALIVARLLWGLSFAAMNIATQASATAEPTGAARRSGRMRAVIAAGPVSGLIGGALVSQFGGPRVAFLLVGLVALVAFLFALRLPNAGEGRPQRLARQRFGTPARLDSWAFVQGLTLDGLFVLGISILAAVALPGYAALAAGAALALRYIAEIFCAGRWGSGAPLWCAPGADAAIDCECDRAGRDRLRLAVVGCCSGGGIARPDPAAAAADRGIRASRRRSCPSACAQRHVARSRRRGRAAARGRAVAYGAACTALWQRGLVAGDLGRRDWQAGRA